MEVFVRFRTYYIYDCHFYATFASSTALVTSRDMIHTKFL